MIGQSNCHRCCSLFRREPDYVYENGTTVWRHTGRPGYYLLIGAAPGRCTVSGKETNYVDTSFEVFLHPEHLEDYYDEYIKTVQPSLLIN